MLSALLEPFLLLVREKQDQPSDVFHACVSKARAQRIDVDARDGLLTEVRLCQVICPSCFGRGHNFA
jgi:hypothetical protein